MQTFCTFYFSAKRFLAEPRGLATFWKSKKSKTCRNIFKFDSFSAFEKL